MRAIESFSLLLHYYNTISKLVNNAIVFIFNEDFVWLVSKRESARAHTQYIVTNLCFAKMNDVVSEGSLASDVDYSRDRIFKYPYFLPESLLTYHD